jgi:hypothetical protein
VDQTVTGQLAELCRHLVSDAVTVEEMATAVGTVTSSYSDGQRLVVEPSSPHFGAARVSSGTRDGVPTLVRLDLSETAALTVEDLRAAFGEYEEAGRLHFDDDPRLIFHPETPADSPWTCTLIASIPIAHIRQLDRAPVTSLSLRRDRRR